MAVLPRGLGSNKAARTYKAWYEVPIGTIGEGKRYKTLCNGGDFSPFYRDDSGVADWVKEDGALLVTSGYPDGSIAYDQRNTEYYFSSGLSFPKQSSVFNVAALTKDAIPTREGKAIVFSSIGREWEILGYLNSSLVRYFVDVTTGLHKQSGSIGLIPIPKVNPETWSEIGRIAKIITSKLRDTFTQDEASRLFIKMPFVPSVLEGAEIVHLYEQIDQLVAEELGVNEVLNVSFRGWALPPNQWFVSQKNDFISYCVGVIFGRWDIYYSTGDKRDPNLPDLLASLPDCPPGMLQDNDGLPLTATPDSYPIKIQWDGLLVDDEGNSSDVVGRIQRVIELLWDERAESIEREACEILGVKSLRDYFRKPTKGGFWDDHVKRYSKSRRQAPIYWLLQSSKRNYALWLYYHRLDKDILYKALVNYVEPKLRLEEAKLADLRAQSTAAGNTGPTAKRLAGEVEKQEDLMSELYDFRDRLKRAANLNLEPDLNDGVALNIAPLHELVPWKVAKQYWDELLEGKYEWSSISKQLRAQGKIS